MKCVEHCLNDKLALTCDAYAYRLIAKGETLPLVTPSAVNSVTEDAPTYTVYVVMRTDIPNGIITPGSRCMIHTVNIAQVSTSENEKATQGGRKSVKSGSQCAFLSPWGATGTVVHRLDAKRIFPELR